MPNNGQPFDYGQIARLRATLPPGTPIAVTEAGVRGYDSAKDKAAATAQHLASIAAQLRSGDYLLEQILYKQSEGGFEGSITPNGVSEKGRAVFNLYARLMG